MGRVIYFEIALVLLCFLQVVVTNVGQTCGKRKVINKLIVNGTEAKDGYWPWHVTLFHINGPSQVYACGGTILDQNTVLTAAHCVRMSNGIIALERLVVHVGRNRLHMGNNRVQEHEAFQVIVHPEYNVNSIRHDIAMIKLTTDISYTDYIQPICLWNRGEDLKTILGTMGTVVGFGRDETGNVSNTLREATIPVVSHITCIESNREAFALHLTSDMYCAGNRDGIGACNGDSGGGMFFKYDDVWYIRGVVSFTKPHQDALICDSKEYTVFADVAKYLKWIEQHLRGAVAQTLETRTQNSNKIELLPMSTCGVNPYADREESHKPLFLGYPWVGLLEYTINEESLDEPVCHGTLINDIYLITVIICYFPEHVEYKLTTVRLGEYEINSPKDCVENWPEGMECSPPVQRLRIDSVVPHPEYEEESFTNNIALIRLQDRADTSQSNVKPICLPVTNELRNHKATQYIKVGWNHLYALKPGRSMLEIMTSTECEKRIKRPISGYTCTKRQYLQVCLPERFGNPLQLVQQVQGKSRYVLHGVLLAAFPCNQSSPEIYTSIGSHMDWILENILE